MHDDKSTSRGFTPRLALGAILALMILALRLEGRIWWCKSRDWSPWITNVFSSHCSQHLADPYSLTHISHGFFFWWGLWWFRKRLSFSWRLTIALAFAAAWEVLENTPWVIDRYRSATMSLDYMGDSVLNSLGDVLSALLGFLLARWLGWKWTLAAFIAVELALLALIKDNLTLNVLMLIYPITAIRDWQAGGH